MSQPPDNLAANEIVFYFETNQPIPAGDVGRFIVELGRIAQAHRYLGPDGVLELVEVQTGTLWVKLLAIAGLGGSFAAMGSFALDVSDRLQSTDNRLAQCAAKMVMEHGIRATTVITCEGSIEILRDMMPQVEKLEHLRARKEESEDSSVGFGDGSFGGGTFGGGPIGGGPIGGEPIRGGKAQLADTKGLPPEAVDSEDEPEYLVDEKGNDIGDGDGGRLLVGPDRPSASTSPTSVSAGYGKAYGKAYGAGSQAETAQRTLVQDAVQSVWGAVHREDGWYARPNPPATGPELPIVTDGKVVNFPQTTANVRGHVLLAQGRKVAFMVDEVLRRT
jgi:hypothetical protein